MLQNRDGKINNTYFYLKSLEPKAHTHTPKKKKKTFFNADKPKANHSAIAAQNTKVDHSQPQTKFHEQLKWRKNSIL